MRREGLTVTMVFLAESANYGEGIGNISTLKKMSRGNHEQYSYISRQAMRYNIVRQANWDQTPVTEKAVWFSLHRLQRLRNIRKSICSAI